MPLCHTSFAQRATLPTGPLTPPPCCKQSEYLHYLGAHDVVVAGGETPVHKSDAIRKLGGVDMAFEAVGEPMFSTSLRCLRCATQLPWWREAVRGCSTGSSCRRTVATVGVLAFVVAFGRAGPEGGWC